MYENTNQYTSVIDFSPLNINSSSNLSFNTFLLNSLSDNRSENDKNTELYYILDKKTFAKAKTDIREKKKAKVKEKKKAKAEDI